MGKLPLRYFLDMESLCGVNANQIPPYIRFAHDTLMVSYNRDESDKAVVDEDFCRIEDEAVFGYNHKSGQLLLDLIYGLPNNEVINRLFPVVQYSFKQIKADVADHIPYGKIEDGIHPNARLTAIKNPHEVWILSEIDHYHNFRNHQIKQMVLSKECGDEIMSVFFPNIKFICDSLKSYRKLSLSDKSLLIDDLIELNNYIITEWRAGDFQVADFSKRTGVDASDESVTTKNDPKLKKERLFSIPGIGSEYCFLHIKISNTRRIHFYPDSRSHTIYVPYIGKHLKTAKNR